MIIGHWGEFIPFFLERMDETLFADHLKHPVSYYFKNNFYMTPSGMLTKPQFDLVKKKWVLTEFYMRQTTLISNQNV